MSSGGKKKNQNDYAEKQAKAAARSAKRQGYSVLDQGAQQLEDYTSQLETAAGDAVSSMGQQGMFTFGGPRGRQAGEMREADDFGISMADTDPDSIAGFDRDRWNEVNEKIEVNEDLDDLSFTLPPPGMMGQSVAPSRGPWDRDERSELEKERDKLKDSHSRDRANRIRSGWEDALDDVGDTELDMPGQMAMAQGSNLLNLSRMRAGMERDVSKITNQAMTAADSAFFDSQQQKDNANYAGKLADEQRRAERTQNWIRGIAGGATLAAGTILTGGLALGATGPLFASASATGSIGMMGSGATQLGSSFI